MKIASLVCVLVSVSAPVLAQTSPQPLTLFNPNFTPPSDASPDTAAVEVATKFTTSMDGSVSAIRFYKTPNNTGAHTGDLWDATGHLIASTAFTGETASGWQQANFKTPVPVSAGQTYYTAFHSTTGYPRQADFFTNPYTSGPLTAVAGTFNYASTDNFPNQTWSNTSYFVDMVFTPVTAVCVGGTITTSGNGTVNVAIGSPGSCWKVGTDGSMSKITCPAQ